MLGTWNGETEQGTRTGPEQGTRDKDRDRERDRDRGIGTGIWIGFKNRDVRVFSCAPAVARWEWMQAAQATQVAQCRLGIDQASIMARMQALAANLLAAWLRSSAAEIQIGNADVIADENAGRGASS